MPRFFFHHSNGQIRIEDYQGHIYDTAEDARRAAEQIARDLLVTEPIEDHEPDGRRFEIEDADGRRIATIQFKDLLPPELNAD